MAIDQQTNSIALFAIAIGHHRAGRLQEADSLYRQILVDDGQHAECLHHRGVIAYQCGRLDDATTMIGQAIVLAPGAAEAHANLGNVFAALGKPAAAARFYGKALAVAPAYAEARNNLGSSLKMVGRVGDAITAYRVALALAPEYADALNNLANALQEHGRRSEAVLCYRRALTLQPDYAEAHHNLGMLLLLMGHDAEGWRACEWRWRAGLAKQRRPWEVAQWRGEPLRGRTILLHAEQGMGDVIQFCRFVPLVAAAGGRVVLEAHACLRWMLRGLPGVAEIVAAGDPLPPMDLHCPLMSLPLAFATRTTSIPASVPYLDVDAGRTALWRDRIGAEGLRIGIVWQGSPTYRFDHQRSLPLACFTPLGRVPGVRLISLQKRHGLDQLLALPEGLRIETLGDDFDEGEDAFVDTSAVMMTLDLIVTVDTATAHLGGALARPVWVPLAFNPHWVWGLDRDDTPWYPHTRLFRQQRAGDWQGPFEAMAAALVPWAAAKGVSG